ncbi:MAG TPA: glycerate kinase [Candidatus Binatia bacterium]|nr:glycerate kinase [Candidatus Binatia bacterium]
MIITFSNRPWSSIGGAIGPLSSRDRAHARAGRTAAGKAPAEVARRAARLEVPCVAVAGAVEEVPDGVAAVLSPVELAEPGRIPGWCRAGCFAGRRRSPPAGTCP